jgi:hypothetical protein
MNGCAIAARELLYISAEAAEPRRSHGEHTTARSSVSRGASIKAAAQSDQKTGPVIRLLQRSLPDRRRAPPEMGYIA